jgi:hypothetical protein
VRAEEVAPAYSTDAYATVTQADRIEAKLDRILALLEKPKRERKAKDEAYPPGFERLWSQYPKRAGRNPKDKAYKALNARLKEERHVGDIEDGLIRYAAYCKAMGKIGTEYVMQAATFFGPGKEWESDWQIPDMATQPRTDDEWIAYGQKQGIVARPGESMAEYKQRLMGGKK